LLTVEHCTVMSLGIGKLLLVMGLCNPKKPAFDRVSAMQRKSGQYFSMSCKFLHGLLRMESTLQVEETGIETRQLLRTFDDFFHSIQSNITKQGLEI
jgi:hypothetical protein